MDSGLYFVWGPLGALLEVQAPPAHMRRLDGERGEHGSESPLCVYGELLRAGFLKRVWYMRECTLIEGMSRTQNWRSGGWLP